MKSTRRVLATGSRLLEQTAGVLRGHAARLPTASRSSWRWCRAVSRPFATTPGVRLRRAGDRQVWRTDVGEHAAAHVEQNHVVVKQFPLAEGGGVLLADGAVVRARREDFQVRLDGLTAAYADLPATQAREAKIEDLRQFAFHKGSVRRFTAHEAIKLIQRFHELGDWPSLTKVHRRCPALAESELAFELAGNAYLRMGDWVNARRVANRLIDQHPRNGEGHYILGHSLAMEAKRQQARDGSDTTVLFVQAKQAFKMAFHCGGQAYHLAEFSKASLQLGFGQTARDAAHIIHLTYTRDGGRNSTSFQTVLAELQGAYIRGAEPDEIAVLRDQLSGLETEVWRVRYSIQELEELLHSSDAMGCSNSLRGVVFSLKMLLSSAEKGQPLNPTGRELSRPVDPVADEVHRVTFDFRDGNFHIPGAFNFSPTGIAPPWKVNRADYRLFQEVLKMPIGELIDPALLSPEQQAALPPMDSTLMSLATLDEFLPVVRIYMRQHFSIDGQDLEDLHSAGHKEFEEITNSVMRMLKATPRKTQGDTNISAGAAVHFGDCRWVAVTTQILHDVWQREHSTRSIEKAWTEKSRGGVASYVMQALEVSTRASSQLRVMPVRIDAKIEMNEMYEPRKTPQGRLVAADDYQAVEEHTLNVVVNTTPDGRLVSLRLADNFYGTKMYPGMNGLELSRAQLKQLLSEGFFTPAIDVEGAPIRMTPLDFQANPNHAYADEGHSLYGMPVKVEARDMGVEARRKADIYRRWSEEITRGD